MKFNIYSRFILLVFMLIGLSNVAWSQNTITGTVTDTDGEPLIGANILIKGTSVGTITDLDGNFSLSSNLPVTLIISYTGYTAEEVTVTDGSPVAVSLTEGDIGRTSGRVCLT